MGLFAKERCILCGNTAGAFERTKMNDGTFLCSNCVAKTGLSQGFTSNTLKTLSLNDIKKRIEYHNNDVNENQKRVNSFEPTHKFAGYIWFDDNHKWFVLPQGLLSYKIDDSYVFKYDEILDFEVLEDGTSVTKGGLGKALVGGYLFGLAGAIAGGTSKKTKQICTQLQIRITTRNSDYPTLYINLLQSETKKSSFAYKGASRSVQDIISKFQIIFDQFEQEKGIAKEKKTNYSVADEIKKFKELLDMGAITQEEFDEKKKQLLG